MKYEVIIFVCSSLSSRGEPISSVVVRCFTEALPENRYIILIIYISTQDAVPCSGSQCDLSYLNFLSSQT